MRVRPLVGLLTLLPLPACAADGGVFCKGPMFFIARAEPAGALAFNVMGHTQQQNIIQVQGIAVPHAGGWRYQVKSASTPELRCTVDIAASGGGYSLRTVPGAECVSSGGIGASALIGSASFPASSRLAGIATPAGKPDDFPEVDCQHKRYF